MVMSMSVASLSSLLFAKIVLLQDELFRVPTPFIWSLQL